LPPAPQGFLASATLQLEKAEAEYLRERIIQSAPGSLFAFLADHLVDSSNIAFPWEHPLWPQMTATNHAELDHARNFSETMHGAALLYNLMLAEKKQDETRVQEYKSLFSDWAELISTRFGELAAWSRSQFWDLVLSTGARIGQRTPDFINAWFGLALRGGPELLCESTQARNLIAVRERSLKGSLARLDNGQALNQWGGASSSGRFDYRWNRPVKAMLADLRSALVDA
jgi:hypothetical protein